MIYTGGFLHYDTPIGILCLETYFPKPPGHLRNPLTFDFPIVAHVLKGIDIERMLFKPSPDLLAPFVEGAKQLERDGVKAIIGSCGFMALYQKELSKSITIPIFSSSLAQLSLMRLAHGQHARIGILTASSQALTANHFKSMGADIRDYEIMGMESNKVFSDIILQQTQQDMDLDEMKKAVCEVALAMHSSTRLDALLLECTDLSAFSKAVQDKLNIPVYDINSLVEYAAYSVSRPTYPKR